MFTIKAVDSDGNQALYRGHEVHFTPADRDVDHAASVMFEDGDRNAMVKLTAGRVYVMNEVGRTVQTFILAGDKEFPRGLMPV